MPKALQNRPEQTIFNKQYIKAFLVLGHFRDEQGSIKFENILLYAKEIDENNALDFVDIILFADRAYKKAAKEFSDSRASKGKK